MMMRTLIERGEGEPSPDVEEIDVPPVEKKLLNFINAFIHVDIIVHVPLVVGVLVDGSVWGERDSREKI